MKPCPRELSPAVKRIAELGDCTFYAVVCIDFRAGQAVSLRSGVVFFSGTSIQPEPLVALTLKIYPSLSLPNILDNTVSSHKIAVGKGLFLLNAE